MDIYQGLLEVLYEHGEFKLAVQRITEARNAISGKRSPYLWGQYHYILAGYYDAVLNGFYDAATKEEAELVRFLLSSVDKAIKYMKLSRGGDSGQLLGEYYRLKALVLIRGGNGTRKQVWTILGKVQRLIDRYAQPNSRLVRDYYMTLAWYYTYVEEESEKTAAYLSKAYEITEIVSVPLCIRWSVIGYHLFPRQWVSRCNALLIRALLETCISPEYKYLHHFPTK